MRSFDYVSSTETNEALDLISDGGRARPLAGGTDLLTLMKADIEQPARLVNIKALPGMAGIHFDRDAGLWVGGLTTLADLELNDEARAHYPALAQALEVAATPQLRNMATVAGNLLQRPRCWYFRNSLFDCWLKGGEACPMYDGENRFAAIFNQSPCWAVHPSDLAPVLMLLDAEVHVRGRQNEYDVAVADLLQPPSEERRTETLLAPDELITSLHIPPPAVGMRTTYLKAMDRKIWAFALAGVAAALLLDGRRVREARIVLSGVANVPIRALAAEELLLGAEIDTALIERVSAAALRDAQPLRDNGYKITLSRALVRRALTLLTTAA